MAQLSVVIRTQHLGGSHVIMEVTLGQLLEPVLQVTAHGSEAIQTVSSVLGIDTSAMVTETIEHGPQTKAVEAGGDVIPALEALDTSTEMRIEHPIEVMYPVRYFHKRYDVEVGDLGFVVDGFDQVFMIVSGDEHAAGWISHRLLELFHQLRRQYRQYEATEAGAADRERHFRPRRQQPSA